jgi:hypothetical protein
MQLVAVIGAFFVEQDYTGSKLGPYLKYFFRLPFLCCIIIGFTGMLCPSTTQLRKKRHLAKLGMHWVDFNKPSLTGSHW